MTGIEAVVSFLRFAEFDELDRLASAFKSRRLLIARNACGVHIHQIRHIRQLIASLRDVERRARVEGIMEGSAIVMANVKADVRYDYDGDRLMDEYTEFDWSDVRAAMAKRIAELESEQPPTREGDER